MSGNIKFRWFLLTLMVLSFLTASAVAETPNKTSLLQINTSDVATGTGFLFSSSDYVITSYHVVHGAKSIRVRLLNGEKIDANIALKDTNNDIAILKLSKSPTSRQNIIVLGDSSLVKTGDRVFTYGFPLVDLLGDAEPRYSEGFINSLFIGASSYELNSLAESIRDNLGDKKWAKLVKQKAKELSEENDDDE